ncbi:hypothetical protein CBM2634_U180006 [Cupriavidus taiwanensis]|uniref:Uncharacterized protein n=1 Tax=Cupriavidus taiwanensis TaxID=164546 RepID=A0A375JEM3_9BURK|nr:hypothetical protein CBM2634_U180006 [Cupriavidus taiwanensis]
MGITTQLGMTVGAADIWQGSKVGGLTRHEPLIERAPGHTDSPGKLIAHSENLCMERERPLTAPNGDVE